MPELSFFKSYLESLGAKLPSKPTQPNDFEKMDSSPPPPYEETVPEPKPEPESEESDVELDTEGVIGGYIVVFSSRSRIFT